MMIKPAIVVSAYNRPLALRRLLDSLQSANYPDREIQLIISIDKSENTDVQILAEKFQWQHGSKKVILHKNHLGLKKHLLSCGDLTEDYSAIIVLEDDLLVSPYFYHFALEAVNYYKDDHQLAGISLYNYQVAESCFYPFNAIDDGSDVYFMQLASSWGQIWTRAQWQLFRQWFETHPTLPIKNTIPNYLHPWGDRSWKKHFIHYLIDNNKYFVFPRLSLTTNFEEPGTHASAKKVFQVPLQLSEYLYKFQNLEKSKAIYDAWFEMMPACLNRWNADLSKYDYAVDLYGGKEIATIDKQYLLSSKIGHEAIQSYAGELFPMESNVAMALNGNAISLYRMQNNSFRATNLPIKNVLEEKGPSKNISFSIVITLDEFDPIKLTKTLQSIQIQKYLNLECLIICHSSILEPLKKCTNEFDLNIITQAFEGTLSLTAQLNLGFSQCNKDIISWIHQDSTFSIQAFQSVASIFTNYGSVNWLMGVDESIENNTEEWKYNSSKIRMNARDTYKAIRNDTLNLNLELCFFKRGTIQTTLNVETLQELFLSLISVYQLTGVVKKFGEQGQDIRFSKLSVDKKQLLLKNYAHLIKHESLLNRFLSFVFKPSFKTNGKLKLIYPILNHYPDVLRYDTVHGTFYFSKY